jgi:hypothetical protein
MNLYTELPWALVCEAVLCLRITIPGGPSPDDADPPASHHARSATDHHVVESAPSRRPLAN